MISDSTALGQLQLPPCVAEGSVAESGTPPNPAVAWTSAGPFYKDLAKTEHATMAGDVVSVWSSAIGSLDLVPNTPGGGGPGTLGITNGVKYVIWDGLATQFIVSIASPIEPRTIALGINLPNGLSDDIANSLDGSGNSVNLLHDSDDGYLGVAVFNNNSVVSGWIIAPPPANTWITTGGQIIDTTFASGNVYLNGIAGTSIGITGVYPTFGVTEFVLGSTDQSMYCNNVAIYTAPVNGAQLNSIFAAVAAGLP